MDSANKEKLSIAGLLIALIGAILFSTKAIIVKKAFASTQVDAVSLLTLRMAFSLPFYLAAAYLISRRHNNVRMTRRQWGLTFAIGLTGYYLSSLFDFIGLQYISAGLERLILFLYPTFAVLLNFFWFRQTIHKNQWIALGLTYAGIGLALSGEVRINAVDSNLWWGSFLVFVCAITYSVYIVGSGKIIPSVGAMKFTAYAMLSATIGVFLHFIAAGNYTEISHVGSLVPYGFLLAVVATVAPSFLISAAMKRIGSNNVAIISSVGPVSTILQAYFFLGEKIFIEQIIGTVLVMIGVLLLGWKRTET
ncbi:MAG: DMT family transporter [Chitinophagaceae bacterium]|nr:MAG: DMT family transporter [Chitinophagaceae bacterium]